MHIMLYHNNYSIQLNTMLNIQAEHTFNLNPIVKYFI